MRIGFSARAWMAAATTGLLVYASSGIYAESRIDGSKQTVRLIAAETSSSDVVTANETGAEPRKLIERPGTREAIRTSRPAQGGLASLFPHRTKAVQQSAQQFNSPDTSTAAAGNSEVQQKLAELYEKNGRPMPELDFEAFEGNRAQHIPQRPAEPSATSPSQGPIRQVASNPFKRFFDRITPFRRKDDPRNERPDHVEALPAHLRAEQMRIQQSPQQFVPQIAASPAQPAQTRTEPAPLAQPQTLSPATTITRSTNAVSKNAGSILLPAPGPASGEGVPVGPEEPVTEESSAIVDAQVPDIQSSIELDSLPQFKPAVQLQADAAELPEFKAETRTAPPTLPELTSELSDKLIGADDSPATPTVPGFDPLDNPFPELSETAADGLGAAATTKVEEAVEATRSAAEKAADSIEVAADANPFTGLTLDAPALTESKAAAPPLLELPEIETPEIPALEIPETPRLTAAPEFTQDVEKTVAGQKLLMPELPALPSAPGQLSATDSAEPDTKLPVIEPSAPPKAEGKTDKMRKIKERSELKGLKGFCPVALRDERDLRDARPQFKAEYLGQVYNFSTLEAQEKFASNPSLYAPAAGGADVVLTSGEEARTEGTLDHAVWFKDRLYLFDSQKSLQTFVVSPAEYAVGEE